MATLVTTPIKTFVSGENVTPDNVIDMLLRKIPIASNERAKKMLGR